jgi:hypothetical protein
MSQAHPNVRSMIGQLRRVLTQQAFVDSLVERLRFDEQAGTVSMDMHLVPEFRRKVRHARYAIHLGGIELVDDFEPQVEERIAQRDDGRGRVLYCTPAPGADGPPVWAALSFHLPKPRARQQRSGKEPLNLQVMDVGVRVERDLWPASVCCAFMLKQYVHALAFKLGRDTDVVATVPNATVADFELLGFRQGPKEGFGKGNHTVMVQPPLSAMGGRP